MKNFILGILCFTMFITGRAQTPSLVWARSFNSTVDSIPENTQGVAVGCDNLKNVYSFGQFTGMIDFDPGVGVYSLDAGAETDAYVSKLDSMGNFIWARKIGNTDFTQTRDLSVDSIGNLYSVGYFSGLMDFDPGPGTHNVASLGVNGDYFILKLDSAGNFLWARTFGGDSSSVHKIEMDLTGNVYVVGDFSEGVVDFNPGAGVFNLTAPYGNTTGFILKLNSSGNFVWAKSFGGAAYGSLSDINSIKFDRYGNIYTTGRYYKTIDFDPSAGVSTLTSIGSSVADAEIFVLKLDSMGGFIWVKSLESNALTFSSDISVDTFGNVYTVGRFAGTLDLDPNVGVSNFVAGINSTYYVMNGFISKLDSLGNFVWGKQLYDTLNAHFISIEVDIHGNIYTAGLFNGMVDFDLGSGIFNLNPGAVSIWSNYTFVTKFDYLGNFIWAGSMNNGASGTSYNLARSLVVNNHIYLTGDYYGTIDFDPTGGVTSFTSTFGNSSFVAKLSNTASFSSLEINEINNDTQISIFPNPTNGSFNVFTSQQIKNGSIEIYNIIGELIYSQKITNQQNIIDLQNPASGLYFVKVINDGEVIGMKKVVKE